jgi:hypothetical protein
MELIKVMMMRFKQLQRFNTTKPKKKVLCLTSINELELDDDDDLSEGKFFINIINIFYFYIPHFSYFFISLGDNQYKGGCKPLAMIKSNKNRINDESTGSYSQSRFNNTYDDDFCSNTPKVFHSTSLMFIRPLAAMWLVVQNTPTAPAQFATWMSSKYHGCVQTQKFYFLLTIYI